MTYTTFLNQNGPVSMFLDQQVLAFPPLINSEDPSSTQPPSAILSDPSVDLFGTSPCRTAIPCPPIEELLPVKDVAMVSLNYESTTPPYLSIDPLVSATAEHHHQSRYRHDSISSSSSSNSSVNNKVFSFVRLPGMHPKKRPRRRFDEIERLYHCTFGKCKKSYGTLNHLNSHIVMQAHGSKRHPSEFKEMRKEWRRAKKQRDSIDQTNRQQEAQWTSLMATAAMATASLHF